ncbi:MAG TPA: hypothetical protein VGL11_24045 [Candidatus Binatia bacterium]
MKIATSFLTALLMASTVLGARLLSQGFIPALVATVIEQGSKLRRAQRRKY